MSEEMKANKKLRRLGVEINAHFKARHFYIFHLTSVKFLDKDKLSNYIPVSSTLN